MIYRILITLVAFLTTIAANANHNPQISQVSLGRSYIPVGFDDNDRTQVMVAGRFSSTCYKVGPSKVTVDQKAKTIKIFQSAYKYSGVCLRMMVPFSQTVNIGLLDAGKYKLMDGVSGTELGSLAIQRSTHAGADDFLYAPVMDAFILADGKGHKRLILTGEFMDSCLSLRDEDIKIHYYKDVIVVQPVARRSLIDTCKPQQIPFSNGIEIPDELAGVKLLHVRSMNGQAINKLVDVDTSFE